MQQRPNLEGKKKFLILRGKTKEKKWGGGSRRTASESSNRKTLKGTVARKGEEEEKRLPWGSYRRRGKRSKLKCRLCRRTIIVEEAQALKTGGKIRGAMGRNVYFSAALSKRSVLREKKGPFLETPNGDKLDEDTRKVEWKKVKP